MFCKRAVNCGSYFLYTALFGVITAPFMLLYFSSLKSFMINTTSKICLADFIDRLADGSFINILLIPLCTIFVVVLSQRNAATANYYIRNKSRKHIIIKRMIRVLILSAAVSAMTVIVSIFIAGLFASRFINWNEHTSFFCLSRGTTLNIGFITVLAVTFLKLFFPALFFSVLVCTLDLVCKKVFAFLIAALLSALNVFGFVKFLIDGVFNSTETQVYLSVSSAVLLFVVFPLLSMTAAFTSVKLVGRKDFLS